MGNSPFWGPSSHTTSAILHLPNYTVSSQIKDTLPIVRIPSHPNIHADPPSGGTTWTEPDLRHPTPIKLKNELCQIKKYRLKLKHGQLTVFGPAFWGGEKLEHPFFFFWARGNCASSRARPIPHTFKDQAGTILNLKSR
jgi:hypothetical protein